MIFEQELNEVYLLLDFISGRPDRHLSDLDGKIDHQDVADTKYRSREIIERVSQLRYPPSPSPDQRAKDAAFLLLVKDLLNATAFPARGQTIAYTTMFAEERQGARTSRVEAARLAYPGLVSSADGFRRWKDAMAWLGLVITVLAATLLWQVTYGVQLVARFDEAKRNDASWASKVYDQLGREDKSASTHTETLDAVCAINVSIINDRRSSSVRQICDEYAYRHALLCVSITDISVLHQSTTFKLINLFVPVHELQPAQDCSGQAPDGKGRQEDAQSVAGVLAIMSNYVLPILFGLIGTLAALVRGIQDKVTENTLTPRDQALGLMRFPIGMIAGVCVGLFITPASVASNGGIGSFTISASGIAFLAGYGAEAFFRALDVLVTRVLSLSPETRIPAR